MPYCAILSCRNDSRKNNLSNGGISYHRFPKDDNRKTVWINATGRVDWVPLKTSTLCSKHFAENDFLIAKKGNRYLRSTAVPSIRNEQKTQTSVDTQRRPSKRTKTSNDRDYELNSPKNKFRLLEITDMQEVNEPLSIVKIEMEEDEFDSEDPDLVEENEGFKEYDSEKIQQINSLTGSPPAKKQLEGKLRWSQDTINRQILKIKRLQTQNRRYIQKITKLELSLKEKISEPQENFLCLKNTNSEINELVVREVYNASGVTSTKKYSPTLRSFASTLHNYSPKAYDFVRNKFHSLPHPRTLRQWDSETGVD